MITDTFMIYLLFQVILLMINLIGYSKLPFLGFIGIIGVIILAYPTAQAFEPYWQLTVILLLTNLMIPVLGFSKARHGK